MAFIRHAISMRKDLKDKFSKEAKRHDLSQSAYIDALITFSQNNEEKFVDYLKRFKSVSKKIKDALRQLESDFDDPKKTKELEKLIKEYKSGQ